MSLEVYSKYFSNKPETDSEVEFLLETSKGIIPLEIKSGWVTQSKSLKVFEEKVFIF